DRETADRSAVRLTWWPRSEARPVVNGCASRTSCFSGSPAGAAARRWCSPGPTAASSWARPTGSPRRPVSCAARPTPACRRSGAAPTRILPVAPADSGPTVTVDSLGAVVARQAGDSAADQAVLDSLHAPRGRHADSLTSRPAAAAQGVAAVRGEDVEREAVR